MTNPPKRRQRDYVQAGRAQRQALERAVAHGCTPAELTVLTGVFYWTTSFAKLSDRVTTGQIATVTGLWDGDAKDCPKHIRRRVAERLDRLTEAGAIEYRAGGSKGPGSASYVALPPPTMGEHSEVPETPPVGEQSQVPQGGAVTGTPTGPWGSTQRDLGEQSQRPGGALSVTKGATHSSPPRKISGKNSRGDLPGTTGERALIDRLTATTATLPRAIAQQLGRTPDQWPDHITEAQAIATTLIATHGHDPDTIQRMADHIEHTKPYSRGEVIGCISALLTGADA